MKTKLIITLLLSTLLGTSFTKAQTAPAGSGDEIFILFTGKPMSYYQHTVLIRTDIPIPYQDEAGVIYVMTGFPTPDYQYKYRSTARTTQLKTSYIATRNTFDWDAFVAAIEESGDYSTHYEAIMAKLQEISCYKTIWMVDRNLQTSPDYARVAPVERYYDDVYIFYDDLYDEPRSPRGGFLRKGIARFARSKDHSIHFVLDGVDGGPKYEFLHFPKGYYTSAHFYGIKNWDWEYSDFFMDLDWDQFIGAPGRTKQEVAAMIERIKAAKHIYFVDSKRSDLYHRYVEEVKFFLYENTYLDYIETEPIYIDP